jgi:hypothetical protein
MLTLLKRLEVLETRLKQDSSNWVSGSIEAKSYGKGTAGRARERKRTLPRRSLFGKDSDKRSRIFNGLHVLVSPL